MKTALPEDPLRQVVLHGSRQALQGPPQQGLRQAAVAHLREFAPRGVGFQRLKALLGLEKRRLAARDGVREQP
jgi:hypothetical protein